MVDARSIYRHVVDINIERPPEVAESDRVEIAGSLVGFDDLTGFFDHEG